MQIRHSVKLMQLCDGDVLCRKWIESPIHRHYEHGASAAQVEDADGLNSRMNMFVAGRQLQRASGARKLGW